MKGEIIRIKGLSKAIGGTGKEYTHDLLCLRNEEGLLVIQVDETPGRWFLQTLLEGDNSANRMSIDRGQNWVWVNSSNDLKVMIEAIKDKGISIEEDREAYQAKFGRSL